MPELNGAASLTFYPAYCFPASPTYNVWVKLTVATVHALQQRPGYEGQYLYFHLNHPIQWVQVTGVIVGLGDFDSPVLWFYVDDGSGAVVEVAIPREKAFAAPEARSGEIIRLIPNTVYGRSGLGNLVDFKPLKLGMLVKAKGGLKTYRGKIQISLERLFFLRDTSDEQQFWTELASFYESTLSRAWILSISEQNNLKDQEKKMTRLIEDKRARKRARDLGRKRKEVVSNEYRASSLK